MGARRRSVMLFFVFLLLFSSCKSDAVELTSSIEKENCYLCGEVEHSLDVHRGESGVGVLDLNTFTLQVIELNRIERANGAVNLRPLSLGGATGSMLTDAGRGHVNLNVSPGTGLDGEALEGFLCQSCLDKLSEKLSCNSSALSLAVVDFSTCEVRLLDLCSSWFTMGDFLVISSVEKGEELDLHIIYAPPRY